jgi:hypothetical protein
MSQVNLPEVPSTFAKCNYLNPTLLYIQQLLTQLLSKGLGGNGNQTFAFQTEQLPVLQREFIGNTEVRSLTAPQTTPVPTVPQAAMYAAQNLPTMIKQYLPSLVWYIEGQPGFTTVPYVSSVSYVINNTVAFVVVSYESSNIKTKLSVNVSFTVSQSSTNQSQQMTINLTIAYPFPQATFNSLPIYSSIYLCTY